MLIFTTSGCYLYILCQLYVAACFYRPFPPYAVRMCHAVVARDALNMDRKSVLIKYLHIIRVPFSIPPYFRRKCHATRGKLIPVVPDPLLVITPTWQLCEVS
jgi:hypothetical protein